MKLSQDPNVDIAGGGPCAKEGFLSRCEIGVVRNPHSNW
jgi:hypothetical protein